MNTASGAGAHPVGQVGAGRAASADVGDTVRWWSVVARRVDDGAGVARDAAALHRLGLERQPSTGSAGDASPGPRRRRRRRRAARRAPCRPAMPEKQWNQATGRRRQARPARWSQSRATAQAAPKPLSMPTTVTPARARAEHRQQRGDAVEAPRRSRRSWARRRPAPPSARRPRWPAPPPCRPRRRRRRRRRASSRVASRRWRPATPTSSRRLGREPVGAAARPRTRRRPGRRRCPAAAMTTRSGRVRGRGPPDDVRARRRPPPGWAAATAAALLVGRPGEQHRTVAAVRAARPRCATHCSGVLPGP